MCGLAGWESLLSREAALGELWARAPLGTAEVAVKRLTEIKGIKWNSTCWIVNHSPARVLHWQPGLKFLRMKLKSSSLWQLTAQEKRALSTFNWMHPYKQLCFYVSILKWSSPFINATTIQWLCIRHCRSNSYGGEQNRQRPALLGLIIFVLEKDKEQIKNIYNTTSGNDKDHKEKQIRVRG